MIPTPVLDGTKQLPFPMAGITSGTHKRLLLCFIVQPRIEESFDPGTGDSARESNPVLVSRESAAGRFPNQKEKKKSSVGAVAIPLVENVPNVLLKKSSATSGVHVISTIPTYISLGLREKDLPMYV